jgi:hypothetical protein
MQSIVVLKVSESEQIRRAFAHVDRAPRCHRESGPQAGDHPPGVLVNGAEGT